MTTIWTWLHRYRRPLVVAFQLALVVVSNYTAFLLRFDFTFPAEHWTPFVMALPLLLLLRGGTFWAFRLYEGLWRYASIWDLQKIISSVVLSSVVFGLLVRGPLQILPYPRSVFIIDSLVLILLLGGARLVRRVYREFNKLETDRRVLIYGAGDAGELIVRDMKNNRFYNANPIGFIDDDPSKIGRSIHGVKVLGSAADLPRIMKAEAPHEVLVAMPSARPAQIWSIVRSLEPFKTPIKTLPNLRDVLDGRVEINQIRSLSMEDLLSRAPIDLDAEPVRELINGRRVMVTGAGGSIGAEMVRQLADFGPSRLVLVERSENALFNLCQELDRLRPGCSYEPIVADVSEASSIQPVFGNHRPEVVFHAAAHKHVPLMERNPAEAVRNNVRGTRLVAEASVRHGVDEFVLISSDKAVNPSSVMGATKRVCELIVRSLNTHAGPRFVVVRFGNVLGSNGSVTPLFAEQIARGGPVTVTHPEIKRYFMLIPEAVQLVLHAAAMRDAGTIFVLEMGEQIRIQDLARNLIRLSGFVPDQDIEIRFVGLRPGEKLFEELAEGAETLESCSIGQILRVRSQPVLAERLLREVADLERAAEEGRDADVLALLRELVPTFRRPAGVPAEETKRFGATG